jgi:hypothetical protein
MLIHIAYLVLAQAADVQPQVADPVTHYSGPFASVVALIIAAKQFGLLEWLPRRRREGNGNGHGALLQEIHDGVQAGLEAQAEQSAALRPMAETIKDLRHEMTELRVAVAEMKGAK